MRDTVFEGWKEGEEEEGGGGGRENLDICASDVFLRAR